jgi:uridine kinase
VNSTRSSPINKEFGSQKAGVNFLKSTDSVVFVIFVSFSGQLCILAVVSVQNRIVKVQKRNRALVRFDEARICRAIFRAAESIGGFHQDFLPGINDKIFEMCRAEEAIAEFISNTAIVCLNSNPHHLISNFPPTIETIQDEVLHALRSYGFQNTADAYECYRWGRHWLREGAITREQFAGNGFPRATMAKTVAWNRIRGCDTVARLNEIVREGKIKALAAESIGVYDRSLDEAAGRMISRLNAGDRIRMMWVSGPSSSGKTTTTVKLTERLEKQGLRFLMLNLDDYFWPLVEHPTDWINDRNYETPEALDIQLLNEHLKLLLEGKTVEKPIYSFKEGRRMGTKPVRLDEGQVLLLDCLHGLYPPITEGIDAASQFRLYIENQNMLYEGDGSAKTLTRFTDLRLIRRMLRDSRHRNHSPLRTILHWHYVRAGELFSIIPLSGSADHVVNGGFPFDLPALKPFFAGTHGLLPRLEDFESYAGFLDAQIRFEHVKRLIESVEGLSIEQAGDYDIIPGDAVIREFIGGSTIKIPHNE